MQKSKISEVARALRARKARRILFTDIDGTLYQWQLLIVLIFAIAKYYPQKRPFVQPLREAIKGYKKRVTPFSIVIKILISIIPEVFKGVDKNRVRRLAEARARSVGSQVYIFPKTLIDVVLAITDDPWLVVAITGSPQEVADPFCKQRGIHVAIGSFYKSDKKGIYTGKRDIDSGKNKGAYMAAIDEACPEIIWDKCIAMFDSEHDIPMYERCGYAFAINPNIPLLEHIRATRSSKPVNVVRDGQKSGAQIYRPTPKDGLLCEVCPNCSMPNDVSVFFPDLPGACNRSLCQCANI